MVSQALSEPVAINLIPCGKPTSSANSSVMTPITSPGCFNSQSIELGIP